jgi:hypothetical protein
MHSKFESGGRWIGAGLLAGALLIAGCSTERSALPTSVSLDRGGEHHPRPVCADRDDVADHLRRLFRARDLGGVVSQYEHVVDTYQHGDVARAQALAAQLYLFIKKQYDAGALIGAGTPTGAQAVAVVGDEIFCQVGITISLSSALDDNVVAIVPPNTDTIVRTGTANAGVQLFAAQQLPQTVVVIARLPDTAHTAACPQYSGPLCTPFAQFPPFYDYELIPAPALGQSAPPFTVEECVDTTKVHVPLAQLFIAHNVTDTAQILPKTGSSLGLACDGLLGMGPTKSVFELARKGELGRATLELASRVEDLFVTNAYAFIGTGITGQTRSFSPFGPVDVNDLVPYLNGGWTYHAPTITTVPPAPGTGDVPGFQAPGFALDASWVQNASPFGNAPFGSGSAGFGCALSQLTFLNKVWPSFPAPASTGNLDQDPSTMFLLRKTFFLPSTWNQDLRVGAAIDNDVEVFMNGVAVTPTASGSPLFVVHEGCAAQDAAGFVFSVPQSMLLVGQQNVLAIRGRDRGGESYLDARLSPVTPLSP